LARPDAVGGVERLAHHDATLFMVLLAAFETCCCIARPADRSRVGCPTRTAAASRSRLIGLFVNTQVLAHRARPARGFVELLAQ